MSFSQCSSAKRCGMFFRLHMRKPTHVRRAKKHAFLQEHELYRMKQGETIANVHK